MFDNEIQLSDKKQELHYDVKENVFYTINHISVLDKVSKEQIKVCYDFSRIFEISDKNSQET